MVKKFDLDVEKKALGPLGDVKNPACTMSDVDQKPEIVCTGELESGRINWSIPLSEFKVKK